MTPLFAHGIGGVRDLPVPQWLFYYAAAVVLIVSFVMLAALWRRPLLEEAGAGRPLPPWVQRVVLSPALRFVLGAASLAIFSVVALAALVGTESPSENVAPTFIYVAFWLGLVPVVVLLGNVWSVLNPWRTAADAAAWCAERMGFESQPFQYPDRLGRWPAAVLLFGFAALELAYWDPASPRSLGAAILIYSAIAWSGMLAFGRRTWLENGEAFAVYFDFLSRLSALGRRTKGDRRQVVVRPPLTGMKIPDLRPGTLAFVAVMLGSVGFDGFSRTAWWQDRRYAWTSPLVAEDPRLADLVGTLMNVAGLLLTVAAVAAAYLLAVRAAEALADEEHDLWGAFLVSLVPIALAYVVAHYFSLLVLQGQYLVPLASDPLGRDWNLFGTANAQPDLGLLAPNLVWYIQVGALVVGHVTGLVLAHDRAVALLTPRTAVLTQYPFLALMVLYTVGGLWLLSSG